MSEQAPVTWETAKRLFTGADIGFMKMLGFHLDDPNFVSANFNALLGRIEDGTMPPEPFEPWSQKKINTFKAWRDGGFLRSTPPSDEDGKKFIAMSEFLTGFDDLHEDGELAAKYFDRLRSRSVAQGGVDQQHLQDLIAGFDANDTAAFEKMLETPEYETVARTIILLWYTASFVNLNNGFPVDASAVGTPDDNRYISGLVWRAFQAHPMGYSSEGYFNHTTNQYSLDGEPYWKFEPQENGQNTGLGPKSVGP